MTMKKPLMILIIILICGISCKRTEKKENKVSTDPDPETTEVTENTNQDSKTTEIVFGQINQPSLKLINESGITYSPITIVSNQNSTLGASFCKGVLMNHPISLIEIGITPEILESDCNCTVGDFDGNGYLDFAFWGIDKSNPKNQSGLNNIDYENYLVLFFKEEHIIQTAYIKTEPGFPLVYYPKKKEIGQNGEPVSKNDALCIWGESDGYDDYSKGKVFIFDTHSLEFNSVEF